MSTSRVQSDVCSDRNLSQAFYSFDRLPLLRRLISLATTPLTLPKSSSKMSLSLGRTSSVRRGRGSPTRWCSSRRRDCGALRLVSPGALPAVSILDVSYSMFSLLLLLVSWLLTFVLLCSIHVSLLQCVYLIGFICRNQIYSLLQEE